MKAAKRAYKGWPKGAEKLNRQYHSLNKHAIRSIWKQLITDAPVLPGVGGIEWRDYSGTPHIRIEKGWIPSRGWNWYPARDALAWLLLKQLLPFQVPPAFAAKIREDFDCDLPWLCLADWLEENGEPEHAAHLRAAVERSAWA